jgi:hypothetical protein
MPHPAPAHKSFADRNSLYQEITNNTGFRGFPDVVE